MSAAPDDDGASKAGAEDDAPAESPEPASLSAMAAEHGKEANTPSSVPAHGPKQRGPYRCARCGQPKRGHKCPYEPFSYHPMGPRLAPLPMGLRGAASAPYGVLGKGLLRDPLRFEPRRALLLGQNPPTRHSDQDVVRLYQELMVAVGERLESAEKREYDGFTNFDDRFQAMAHEITIQFSPLLYHQAQAPARVPGMGLTTRLVPAGYRETTFPELSVPTQAAPRLGGFAYPGGTYFEDLKLVDRSKKRARVSAPLALSPTHGSSLAQSLSVSNSEAAPLTRAEWSSDDNSALFLAKPRADVKEIHFPTVSRRGMLSFEPLSLTEATTAELGN